MGKQIGHLAVASWLCREHYHLGSVSRGLTYVSRVSEMEVMYEGDAVVLRARVKGSEPQPYRTEVVIEPANEPGGARYEVTNGCSCPVQLQCKHGVAVVAAAARDRRDIPAIAQTYRDLGDNPDLPDPNTVVVRADQPPAPVATKPAPVVVKPAPQVVYWLHELQHPHGGGDESGRSTVPRPSREILYLIKVKPLYAGLRTELQLTKAARLKAGGWGKTQHFSIGSRRPEWGGMPNEDVAILRKLAGEYSGMPGNIPLEGVFGEEMLKDVVATGRCFLDRPGDVPLRMGEVRRGELAWNDVGQGRQQPVVHVEGGASAVLPLGGAWYVDAPAGVVGPLTLGVEPSVARAWLGAPVVDPDSVALVRKQMEESGLGLPLPREVAIEIREEIEPLPVLTLTQRMIEETMYTPKKGMVAEEVPVSIARVRFDYGGGMVVAPDELGKYAEAYAEGRVVRVMRDMRVERRRLGELVRAGLTPMTDTLYFGHSVLSAAEYVADDDLSWMSFVSDVVPLLRQSGWHVVEEANFGFRMAEAEDWYSDATEEGNDWFGLEVGVVVDGERINLLPVLGELLRTAATQGISLEAVDEAAKLPVRLPDGRIVMMPVGRIRSIAGTLLELFDPQALDADGRLKTSKLRAAELTELAGKDNFQWRGSPEMLALGKKLRSFGGVSRVEPPAGLQATLRDYQRDGLTWLQFLREYNLAGILADDMGLGKTVQALAHLLAEKEAGRNDLPSLVVAPTSLMGNWRREAERFAPALKVLVSHGLGRKEHFERLGEYDLVVTSYPLLPRDQEVLLGQQFHTVILDEAQYIKNPRTKFAQVVAGLKARHRLCMTGTPMENHLGELWSLMNFLMPGYLGNEKQFRQVFRNPIEKARDGERRLALNRRIKPFVLRRRKEDVVKELPPKTEIMRTVDLSGGQRDLYETIRLAMHDRVRQEIASRGMARSQIVILDALLKLRQVCCDPRLVKLEAARKVADSAKLELLMDILPEMLDEGRRVLLFSQFTSMLDLIQDEVGKKKIEFVRLTGETKDRDTPVRRFQDGQVPLFLISLKAGGTGLNLTAADTVIHYDPWWNPAVENQATDRAHRIGQEKPVFVYKLITAGTVEEKIVALQNRKRELLEGLMNEGATGGVQISKEDLEELFAPVG